MDDQDLVSSSQLMSSQADATAACFTWKMKRIIDTNEVLGTVETPQGTCEVCATADANYDESAQKLSVVLDSYLRTTDLLTKEQRVTAGWLPAPEMVREHVGVEEAHEVARDIFHRWVRKVKEAVPALTHV
jgi:hypothetical protein